MRKAAKFLPMQWGGGPRDAHAARDGGGIAPNCPSVSRLPAPATSPFSPFAWLNAKAGRNLSLALLLAACGGPESVAPPTLDHSVVDHPTFVSLNPCTDAILAEIASRDQLLAISHYSHDPAASSMDLDIARQFRSTGGTVEEVLALNPDIVIAGGFLPPATRAAFERLGIQVETFGIASDVETSKTQVTRMAELAGNSTAGNRLNQAINAALNAAQHKVQHNGSNAGAKMPALIWQSGGIVPGEGTLIADLLDRAGFAHFAASRGLGQADRLPLEQVLADPPRVILAAGNVDNGEDRMLAHPALNGLSETDAARFDPSLLYCGGPTIIRAVERLVEIREGLNE